jgi:hypothetical protein
MNMNTSRLLHVLIAFLAAVVFATLWGAVVQTQYNLAALNSIGAGIGAGTNLRTTLADIFSLFTPTYAGLIVAPSLLVAFIVAWLVVRQTGHPALPWYALAGGLAILLAIPLVNYLAPLALLVGAARHGSAVVVMALGGIGAGLLFAWLSYHRLGTAHGRAVPGS